MRWGKHQVDLKAVLLSAPVMPSSSKFPNLPTSAVIQGNLRLRSIGFKNGKFDQTTMLLICVLIAASGISLRTFKTKMTIFGGEVILDQIVIVTEARLSCL